MSRSVNKALALLVAAFLSGCSAPPEEAEPTSASPPEAPAPASDAIFDEVAAEVGLDFTHFNGMTGELYYSEIFGGGGALFDYDQDGDLDLYLTQGHLLGDGKTLDDALFAPRHELPLSDRLYRNELVPSGALRFVDVTAQSGVAAAVGYGMGVATGDVDGNGFPDLYVTNWGGPNQLWRNRGDGTFEDVTARAGVGEPRWSIAAVFFDYDRDGDLDLFAANYLDFSLAVHKECANDLGLPEYCGPVSFKPVTDVLYRNRGDGTFEDVTVAAGLRAAGPGMGAVTGDFDRDGWLDVYVANDEYPNFLLLNQGDGTFREEALLAGSALNAEGHAEAGMGVVADDFDADGDEDLFVTHLAEETNTLYANDGRGNYTDRTIESGLGAPSFEYTGFGTGFLDWDNDGALDLLVANGAVQGIRELVEADDPFPLRQKNLLFHNRGGRFVDVSATAGAAFALSEVSRGAAFGDVDNDGDTDVVIHNNAGPVRLLRNRVGQRAGWLGLRLVGGRPARDLLGAWVELRQPGKPPRFRRVRTDGSYASANDPRLLFGLGTDETPARVRVRWPDGSEEEWRDVPPRVYTTLEQGTGQKPEASS